MLRILPALFLSPPDIMSRRVYQLWRNLGPYHLVRAAAAADSLAARGLELVVVQIAQGEATRDWKISEQNQKKFRVVTLAADPEMALDLSTPSHWPQLRELFGSDPPVGVSIAGYDRPEMRAALCWCRRKGIPSVLMSETKWNDSSRPWWKQLVLRHLVAKADAGLVSGALAVEFLSRLGMAPERIFQPYGVIDNALFRHTAKRCRQGRAERYFLACCRLIESRKNLSTLLAAYASYRQACQNPWPLVICGDGNDRDRYRQQAKDLGIEESVRFAGFLQSEELAEVYAGAGALVHPAKQEAWGLVVNEAMAAGLPVLVSNACGCVPDLVRTGDNGFTFDPHDTLAITELLLRVSNMSDRAREAMGERSVEMIAAWSPEKFGEAHLSALLAAGMSLPMTDPAERQSAEILVKC